MSILYDILIVAVFLFAVWRGWSRGALATMLWLAGWVAAVFIINGWGGIWAERLYSGTVEPWAISAVEEAIPAGTAEALNNGADAVSNIQKVLDQLDGLLGGQTVTTTAAASIESTLRQSSQDLAQSITRTVLRPVLMSAIKGVVFAAILIVVLLVFRILSRFAAARRGGRHGILSRANHLLGGVLGVLEAMAAVYVVAFALNVLANFLTVDWLTPKILSETYLVSRLI